MKIHLLFFVSVIVALPEMAVAFDDNAIKASCKDKWGDNYQMRKYCQDNQRAAGAAVDRLSKSLEPASAMSTLLKTCAKKWRTNYEMIQYCFGNQAEALRALGTVPADVPHDVISKIMKRCTRKWTGNPQMIKYCRDNQASAWRALQ